jgi:hypothetical protein
MSGGHHTSSDDFCAMTGECRTPPSLSTNKYGTAKNPLAFPI